MITSEAIFKNSSATLDSSESIAAPESPFLRLDAVESLLGKMADAGIDAYAALASVLSEPAPTIDLERLDELFTSGLYAGPLQWERHVSDKPTFDLPLPHDATITYSTIAYHDGSDKTTPYGISYGFDVNGRLNQRKIVRFTPNHPSGRPEFQESFRYDDGYLTSHTAWSISEPDTETTDIFVYTTNEDGTRMFNCLVRNRYDSIDVKRSTSKTLVGKTASH